MAIVAMGFICWQAFKRRSLGLTLITVAFFWQWISWTRIDRASFQYHFYTALPFFLLALAYFIAELWHGPSRRTWLLARVAAAIALMFPTLLWLLKEPVCGLARVQLIDLYTNSACGSTSGDLRVETRIAMIAVVLVAALVALGAVLLRLERRQSEGREERGWILQLIVPVIIAFVLVLTAAIVPIVMLHRRRKKRLREFQMQLPSTLNLLSGSMRAGFSFGQGLESVANEATQPTRRELQRVFTESRLGRPMEDALEDSAQRMASVDLMWAVMAIRIQREVGGNLAELLDTVGETMTARERLRLEIKSLTAEARFSGIILGTFPVVFAGILYLVQPDYMGALFEDSLGIIAIIAACIGTFVGFLWLKKLLKIEV